MLFNVIKNNLKRLYFKIQRGYTVEVYIPYKLEGEDIINLVSPSRYQVTLTGAQYHMMCCNVKPHEGNQEEMLL